MEETEYTIPETSPTHYISGMVALNIISGRRTGDGTTSGRSCDRRTTRLGAFFVVKASS